MTILASRAQLRASFLRWALFLVPLVLLLGFLSGEVAGSGPGNPWFASLAKPATYPPPLVFPVVWSVLYVLMGFAAALVAAAWGAKGRSAALAFFAIQLLLNLAWSPVFFAMHRIMLAFGLIVAILLWASVTTLLFWRIRRAAGVLMLPYLVWLCFAVLLNWQVHLLNPNGVTLVPRIGNTQIIIQ